MRPAQLATKAVHLAASSNGQQVVCRSCMSRQFHTSNRRDVDPNSFFGGLQERIFGSKKPKKKVQVQDVAEKQEATIKPYRFGTVLGLDKKKYKVAASPIRVSKNPTYEAAKTADGLPRVGSDAWAKRQGLQKTVYTGFKRRAKRTFHPIIHQKALLYHIAVEVLALHQQGRDLSNVCFGRKAAWSSYDNVRLCEKDGKLALESLEEGADLAIAATIPSKFQEVSPETADEICDRMSEKIDFPEWDGATDYKRFERLPFPSRDVKLAILKRIMQVSGQSIPDRIMSTTNSLNDLVDALSKKDPPARLFDAPQIQRGASLPNVTVFSRRRTKRNAEEAIGRGKLIEQALGEQGLLDAKLARMAQKKEKYEQFLERAQRKKETWLNATEKERRAIKAEKESGLRLVSARPGEARTRGVEKALQ